MANPASGGQKDGQGRGSWTQGSWTYIKGQRRRKQSPLAGCLLVTIFVSVFAVVLVFFFRSLLPMFQDGETGDYRLQFGPEFSPALASRDDLGISVVVAVDVSGSMSNAPATGGRAKYLQAAEALTEVGKVLDRIRLSSPPGQILKVGILRFSDEVSVLMPLTSMDEAGLGRLFSLAEDGRAFLPTGNTAIGKALENGAEMLAQSGTILRSLIVVTDGENTAGVSPEKALAALYANRNTAGSPELPVYTSSTLVSFIGFDIGEGVFSRLGSLGARVSSASDKDELAAALSGLLEADITKLEAPGLGSGGAK